MTSVPELKANAGIYRVIFQDERLTFKTERVKDERASVTAEVTVVTSHPGLDAYIHGPAKLGLLSTQGQASLIRELKANNPALEHLDWPRMVARACREVLKVHRQGEPVISLPEYGPPDRAGNRLEWQGASFMPDLQPTAGFGPAGGSKSLILGNFVAVLVASGVQHAGFEPEPGAVLLLDYEADIDEHKERMCAVARGLGIEPPTNMFYRYSHQPLAADIEQIQRHVVHKNISLVVVDSASPACGGEPESAEATSKYFLALRSLRVATLTIAHTPKAGERDPFGSVFWVNLPRRVYKLISNQKPGDDTSTVGISQRKVTGGSGSNLSVFK